MTTRMSGLSMPIPKALVATATARRVAHELLLRRPAVRLVHARVVDDRVLPPQPEGGLHRVGLLPGGAVDDAPAALGEHPGAGGAPVLVARDAQHLEEEVGAVEPGDEDLGVLHQQRADDVLPHLGGGGGGEGHRARGPEPLPDLPQQRVVGPEVVAPLADAVGLVDGQQRHPHLGQRLDEARAAEALRGDVDQPVGAGPELADALRPLQLGDGGVDDRGRDAPGVQLLQLVLHQGDERARPPGSAPFSITAGSW